MINKAISQLFSIIFLIFSQGSNFPVNCLQIRSLLLVVRSYYARVTRLEFSIKYHLLSSFQIEVRQLEHDYVIREMNDRHDFNFTLTTSTAGCKRDPQNWATMGANWGRENYQDCFTEPVSVAALTNSKLQYEIFNMSTTTQNRISFKEHKANYTFEITVVDPIASYCTLQTKFAVSNTLPINCCLLYFNLFRFFARLFPYYLFTIVAI